MQENDRKIIEECTFNLLKAVGENPTREGLLETPKRVAKFYESFITQGDTPEFNLTAFKNEGNDEMVVIKDIQFFSLCEHHLLPFFGTASVAYIPKDKIIGLSKLPRIVNFFANRPQNQERITTQVGNFVMSTLECQSVAVMLQARHLCMEMRGVKSVGANTVTNFLSGSFKSNPMTRDEFFKVTK